MREIADEVLLGFIATVATLLVFIFWIATRNLKEMAHYIAEHHKMSREHFALVEKMLRDLEEQLRKLGW